MKRISEKTSKMVHVEEGEGVELEEILRRKFVDEHKSMERIAKELNVSYVTVFKWLRLAGIYSRKLTL